MIDENQFTILTAILRASGSNGILAAERILDVPIPERPMVLGQVISRFGGSQENVRQIASGCDIPAWLIAEIRERNTLPSPSQVGM